MSSLPDYITAKLRPALVQTDTILTRLTRMLTTVSDTDKVLLTLYYLLKVLHPQVARLAHFVRPHDQPSKIHIPSAISTSVSLLPRPTTSAVLDRPHHTSASAYTRLRSLESSTKALANIISDYRLITRLWGLLGLYSWAKSTYKSPHPDTMVKALVWTQIVAGVGFQVYENLAVLASKGVLRGAWAGRSKQDRWWILSARFWSVHLVLEALRLIRLKQIEGSRKSREKAVTGENGGKEERSATVDKRDSGWWRAWHGNAAYVPIALHYSLDGGCLSDQQQGLLGLVAGVIGLRELWRTSTL